VNAPPRALSPHSIIAELERGAALGATLPPTNALFPGESDPPVVPDELCVGVLLASWDHPQTRNPYWGPLMSAVRERLLASSCSLITQGLYATTDRTDPLRLSFTDRALDAGVDGIIVASLSPTDPEVSALLAVGIPALFVDELGGPGNGTVMSDSRGGMATVVEHLVAEGRRHIAHISGPLGSDPASERLAGFLSALEKAGLECPTGYIESGDWLSRSAYDAAARLLALDRPPDAIAAASDFQALGALAALEDAGVRVPDDIAVTGFDGMYFTQTVEPQITTLNQDSERIGRTAAEGLLQMIEQPDAPPFNALIPVELVVRASSRQTHERY
jgi:DNA-binding LacI/PurR family transcriptional regulator